ncbi:MAG: type IV pilus secretin PilQ [Nitrosomonadaceae bacterium]
MNLPNLINPHAWLGYSLLFAVVLPTFAAAPDTVPTTKATQFSIENISASTSSSNLLVIKVSMNQPLTNPPAGISLNEPARIYFDFPDTSNALGKKTQSMGEKGLRSINIVQSGNRTRLVMNLSKPLAYDTKIEDKTLLITLWDAASENTSSATTVHFAEKKSNEQKLSLRDVEFHRGAGGEGRIQVDLSGSGAGIDVRKQGKKVIIEFLNATLPPNLERRLNVVDFATPVQTVETSSHGENVRIVIESTGLWEHSAYQADTTFVVDVRALAEDPNNPTKSRPSQSGYVGEKLSLNFQNVQVRAVLQVIADFTGLNIITSDTVTGNLTLRLKDVPWDQALDIMLQAKGLGKRQVGNVIMIAPRDEIAAKEKLELESLQQISNIEPLYTESFQMNYQKADAMKALLGDTNQKMLTKRGSVAIDARTNTLFVRDTPTQLEEIRKLLEQIDVSVRQVMIEARIVEATDLFSRNLGARFGVKNVEGIGSRNLGISGAIAGTEGSADLAGGTAPSIVPPLNVNLPAAGLAGVLGGPAALGLSLIKIGNGALINLELSALEADSKGRIISSPRVVTADQVEATIEQGTEIPFQQATSSGATSISFKKAVLSLKVTPQITPDDNIIMDLNVSQDTVGQQTAAGPAINTKRVNTQVLVENGGTVVIGGIFGRTQLKAVNKVPLLGDIPLLGVLFRNTSKQDDKTELMVFITPRILKESLNLR